MVKNSLLTYFKVLSNNLESMKDYHFFLTHWVMPRMKLLLKKAKETIIKMLQGPNESWDLYCGSTLFSLNCQYEQLHGQKPFTVMFHRQMNELKDYSDISPVLPKQKIDAKALEAKLYKIDNIIIPAIC